MGASGQRLGLRLFLEGVEVPVISAQIQIGLNAPAAASIQIVPGDRVVELKARTMVHLFFWDYTLDNDPAADPDAVTRVAETNEISLEEAKEFVKNNPNAVGAVGEMTGYKLLFCGEIIGLVMAKTPTGRQAVLQCSDFSTYWDTTYQFMASAANLFSSNAHVWAGGASMFDDILDGHMSVLAQYLKKTPKTPGLHEIKGIMGGIISLLEAMGGVPNHMHGVNDFFTIGELKNHILQQIVCEQNDNTAERLFSNKSFWAWLNNAGASMGALVTFRDMLKLLFKYIYYEIVPNPAAMYIPARKADLHTRTVVGRTEDLPVGARSKVKELAARARMLSKTDFYTTKVDDPAQAKQMYAELGEIMSGKYDTDTAASPTTTNPTAYESIQLKKGDGYVDPEEQRLEEERLAASAQPIQASSADMPDAGGPVGPQDAGYGTYGSPPSPEDTAATEAGPTSEQSPGNTAPAPAPVATPPPPPVTVTKKISSSHLRYMERARHRVNDIKISTADAPRQREQHVSGTGRNEITAAVALEYPPAVNINHKIWRDVADLLDKCLGVRPGVWHKEVTEGDPGAVDRLQTQIFRPDCFFVAPPKCNVIFPDQCTSFQYSRNFLQEVTRLRLHEEWEFGINEGLLEQNVHFAPSMAGIKRLAKKQGNSSVRALLEWEIYSGILPKFETIHEVNYASGKSERRLGLKGTGKGSDRTSVKGDAVDYTQRVANFNYLKYRFAARTADVNTRFDPFLVCGYPAVVIDKPFIVDPVADAARVSAAYEAAQISREQRKTSIIDDMSEDIRFVARYLGAPTQYLGMVAGINHNVDQQGGNSAFTLTHARSHRVTEDDFLDIISKEMTREVETEYKCTIIHAEDALQKGDWKKLKILRDVTDQMLGKKLEGLLEELRNASTQGLAAGTQESAAVEERSEGTDFLDTISGLEAFVPLLNMPYPEKDLTLVADTPSKESPPGRVSMVGKVQKVKAKNSQAYIYEPACSGVLSKGGKGPLGGSIVQIQCFSDAAVMVMGLEINKKASGYVTWTEQVALNENGEPDPYIRDEWGNPVGTNAGVEQPIGHWEGEEWVQTGCGATTTPVTHSKRVKRVKDKDKVYMWRSVAIYEEVPVPKAKRLSKLLPVEEALRPPWFSPLYSNWFIGSEIYEKFFGCGSIVDLSYFSSPYGSGAFGTGRKQQQEMLDKLRGAGNDTKTVLSILSEAEATNISDVPDVESSVDVLAYVYGSIKRMGLDAHKFVNDYTRRPIATMKDIFGSEDLAYKMNAKGTGLEIDTGTPGFHSTAILGGDLGKDLLGLVDNPDQPLPRLNTHGKKVPIARILDPRPGRRRAVDAYMEEIGASGQSLGVGVQG
jgi:hypothetical protein